MYSIIDLNKILENNSECYYNDYFFTIFNIGNEPLFCKFLKAQFIYKPIYHKCSLFTNKEAKCGAYIIRNMLTGHFYVGSSNDIYTRIIAHKSSLNSSRHDNINLDKLIKNGNVSDYEFICFFINNRDEAYLVEQYFLDKYRDNILLLNIADDVKKPNLGKVASDEVKEKMSEFHKNDPIAISNFTKILEAKRLPVMVNGKEYISMKEAAIQTGISRTKLCKALRTNNNPDIYYLTENKNPLLGRSFSSEHKNKISEYRKTNPRALAQIASIAGMNKRAIILNGIKYDSVTDAIKATGIGECTIFRKIRELKSDSEEIILDYTVPKTRRVSVLGREYDSISIAAKALGIDKYIIKNRVRYNTPACKEYFYVS